MICNINKDVIQTVILKCDLADDKACALTLVNSSNCSKIYCDKLVFKNENLKMYYEKSIHLTEEEIVKLSVEPVDQSNNKSWYKTRHLRISASSKAHRIKSRTRKQNTELDEFLTCDDKKTNSAMEYGKLNEKKAIAQYISKKIIVL